MATFLLSNEKKNMLEKYFCSCVKTIQLGGFSKGNPMISHKFTPCKNVGLSYKMFSCSSVLYCGMLGSHAL